MTNENNQDCGNNQDPENKRRQRDIKLARFRGWSLTALYFALAVWAIILCYVAFSFWDYMVEQTGGSTLLPSLLMSSSILTFLFSALAGHKFLKAMQSKVALPAVDLLPFMSIAATIVIAGQALGTA